jgi:hypothetical protein
VLDAKYPQPDLQWEQILWCSKAAWFGECPFFVEGLSAVFIPSEARIQRAENRNLTSSKLRTASWMFL